MEAIILIGIQASGKSSFAKERLADTHIRLNLDMLRTRHRENILLQACLAAKQPFVIDNTNPTCADRARYIKPAKAASFRVIGYYFSAKLADALTRNAQRSGRSHIPEAGVRATSSRLELPQRDEGFDELYFVRIEENRVVVEDWQNEI